MMNSLTCRDHGLLRFLRDDVAWPIVVVDAAGAVVESNRAARGTAFDLRALVEEPEDDVWSFLEALESAGARHAVEIARAGRHLLLDGANVYGWRVIAVRDVSELRRISDVPVCIGFGVSTPEQARELTRFSDGVAVGSALVERIERAGSPEQAVEAAARFVAELKTALKPGSA